MKPPEPATVRRSDPKIVKAQPKNNMPPLSPKKITANPVNLSHPQFAPPSPKVHHNNPAIRFESPSPRVSRPVSQNQPRYPQQPHNPQQNVQPRPPPSPP